MKINKITNSEIRNRIQELCDKYEIYKLWFATAKNMGEVYNNGFGGKRVKKENACFIYQLELIDEFVKASGNTDEVKKMVVKNFSSLLWKTQYIFNRVYDVMADNKEQYLYNCYQRAAEDYRQFMENKASKKTITSKNK